MSIKKKKKKKGTLKTDAEVLAPNILLKEDP